MLLGNLSPQLLIANLLVLLFGMGVHEFGHAYVAFLMGDTTARDAGRMTLNPFKNIYWPGWLLMAIAGFGILGSAPINPYRMRNPRWGSLAASAAGPLASLAIALVCAIILRFVDQRTWIEAFSRPDLVNSIPEFLVLVLVQGVWLNIVICVLSFVPLFPLDGWYVAYSLLPPDLAYTWQRHQQTTFYIFIFVMLSGFIGLPLLSWIIGQPSTFFFQLFMGL